MLAQRQIKYYVTIQIAPRGAPVKDHNPSTFGHMWYVLEDSTGTKNSYGFAPSKEGMPFWEGEVMHHDDTNYGLLAYSKTIELTQDQYNSMTVFGIAPQLNGFNMFYTGTANNCIDFVWKGLEYAGLNPSHNEGAMWPLSNIPYIDSIHNPYLATSMVSTPNLSFGIQLDPETNRLIFVEAFLGNPTIQPDLTLLEFGGALKDSLLFDSSMPQLDPSVSMSITDLDGNKQFYELVDGDPAATVSDTLGARGELSSTGVLTATTRNGETIGVIAKDALLTIRDEILGTVIVPAQQFFQMLGQRAEGFAVFTGSIIENAVRKLDGATTSGASQMVAQIMAGLIQGQDIEDIAKDIAVQVVKAGAIKLLIAELKNGDLKSIIDLQNPSMAMNAVQGAITAVAVSAIMHGRDMGLKDYVEVAATASVQRVITQGVDSYFVKLGLSKVEVVNNGVRVIQGPANAGIATALVYVASSVVSGNGITEDTLRGAATAGAIASASSTIVGFMQLGAEAGGAVGIVVGAVLGLVVSNLFRPGGERVYHHETIGSVKQAKPDGTGDVIIGVREAGALLMAGSGADDLIGTVGDDVLVGNDKYNVLTGNAGDDMLEGRANDDALLGGDGHDHIEAGAGDDYVEGNDGNDKIFGDEGNDNILAGPGDDMVFGGAGDDNIEGEEGDDFISGDSGNDVILAGPGNDVVEGRDGDDVIDAGPGDDQVEGNIGNDEIHGGDGQDRLMGGPGNDLLNGDADNDLIYGDEGIDMLYGELGDDILDGGDGADLLFGGMGKDVLAGGDGDDHLYGELDDDYLAGEKGDDLLSGGDGNDVYVFGRGDGHDSVEDSAGSKDIVRLANYVEQEIALVVDGNDLILRAPNGVDSVRLINQLIDTPIELLIFADGRAMNMTSLVFNMQGVPSYTFSSEDTTALITQTTFPGTWRSVSQAANFLNYNPASSWYQQNFDTSVISSATEMQLYNDVQIRATVDKRRSWYGRTRVIINYNDYYQTRLVGTEGSDRIVGAYWAETINGLGGNDQLYGNSGDDTIDGGTEHDYLLGGSQADVIQGGDGHDKVYGGMGDDTINGGTGNDALMGDDGNDIVHGDDGDDIVSGNAGDDTLYGDAGHDELYGDAGIDRLYGGDGNDFIVGGEGNDIADGGTGDDFIEGDVGNDQLSGGDGDDTLLGGDGDDSLSGGTGKDLLVGGRGADVLDGGGDVDTVSYLESDSGVTINLATGAASGGHATGDSLTQIENVIGTDYNDHLTGDSQANYLEGGYGNDILVGADGDDVLLGGAGADTIDGGSGWDTVSYADSASGVEINLATGTGRYGHAEGDTLTNIEHVIGSPFDDTFIVSNSTSTFEAGAGYDNIVLPGPAADYEIILNRQVLTARHIASNRLYSFPDGERLTFDDKSYGLEDFPGDGDAVTLMLENDRANGVILQNPANKTVTLASNGAHGTAVINSDGSYSYAPQTDFLGEDSFAVRVTNPQTRLIRIQNVDVQVNVNGTSPQTIIGPTVYGRDIKRLQDGSYVMVWTKGTWTPTVPYGLDGVRNYQLRMQHYNKDFVATNSEILLAETNEVYSNNGQTVTGEGLAFPKIAALSNGYISLVWGHTARLDGLLMLKQQVLTQSGNPVSSIQILNSANTNAFYPEIIPLRNGGFAVSFDTALPGVNNDIVLQKFDASGNKVRESMITATPLDDRAPKLNEFMNGDILVTWLNSYVKTDIKAMIVYPNGNQSPVMNLCPSQWGVSPTNNLYDYYYDVTVLNQDLFAVVFVSHGSTNYKTLVQVFNTSGIVVGNYTLLTPSSSYVGVNTNNIRIMALSGEQFLVVWPHLLEPSLSEEMQAQLFDFNCNAIGERMVISSPTSAMQQGIAAVFETSKENVEIVFEDPAVSNLVAKTVNVRSILKGTLGNDILQGDTKKNLLISSKGADVLDGGDNSDTVSYQDSDAGVQINLAEAPHTDVEGKPYVLGHGGHAEGDRLRNIENIIGSSFNDTLSGGIGNNVIDGGDGFDVTHYPKNSSAYSLVLREKKLIVTDLQPTVNYDDGTDELTHVEQFVFADKQVAIQDFPQAENSFARVLQNGTAVGTLSNAEPYEFIVDIPPNFGNVSFSNGTYRYIPQMGYLGDDSFSYIIQNSLGLGRAINVTIDVANNISISATERASFQANEAMDGTSTEPTVCKLANGNLLITWHKHNTPNYNYDGVFGRLFDQEGHAISHDFKIDYLSTGDGYSPNAVSFPDGTFMVFWSSGSRPYSPSGSMGIFGQKFDALTHPMGNFSTMNPFIVGQQTGRQTVPQSELLSSGNIVIIWKDEMSYPVSTEGVKGKIVDQTGSTITTVFLIDQGSISNLPKLKALKNGGFVVTWDKVNGASSYDVYTQKYTNDGTAVGNIQRVNSATVGDQRAPTIAETDDGGFVIAWLDFQQLESSDNTNVVVQKYDSNFNPVGSQKNINSTPFSTQNRSDSAELFQNPEIINIKNGMYCVSWSIDENIHFQIVNNDSDRISEEFIIYGTYGAGGIYIHDAVFTEQGQVAITWQEYDIDNTDNNIRTKIIDIGYPRLVGTPGNDVLQSGDGDDAIEGKEGANVYQTGAGKDTVIISVNPNAQEIITDFDLANDSLDLSAYNFLINGFSDLKRHLIQEGADTVIDFGNGHRVVLQNITMANLLPAHFIGTSGANSLPVARLWQAITEPGMNVTIDVLSQASDLDGETLIISSITQPANGTATIVNGTIYYVPRAGFQGIEQLSYVVSDGHGGETIKQLSIVVESEIVLPPQMNITFETPTGSVAATASTSPINSQPATPNSYPASSNLVNSQGWGLTPSQTSTQHTSPPPVASSANRLSNPFSSLFALPAAILGGVATTVNSSSMAEDNIPIDETLPDYNSSVSEQLMLFRLIGHYMKGWMPWNKERELTSFEADTLRDHKTKLGLFHEKLTNFNDGIIESCGMFEEQLSWLDKSIREARSKINSILKKTEITSSQWDELTNKIIKIEKMLDGLTSKQQQLETLEAESALLAEQGKRYAICYDAINDILKIKIEHIKEDPTICSNPWEMPLNKPFGLQQQFWQAPIEVQPLLIEQEPTSSSLKMLHK